MSKLQYPLGQWHGYLDIESIQLRDGRGIYPDWRHLRFLCDGKDILIRHGRSSPYGGRISGLFMISEAGNPIVTPLGSGELKAIPSEAYGFYRDFAPGDTLTVSIDGKHVGQSLITSVQRYVSDKRIFLATPLIGDMRRAEFGFYDTMLYNSNVSECLHGILADRIYERFVPNPGRNSRYGEYQESIRIKDIDRIFLRVGSAYYNKVFPINESR